MAYSGLYLFVEGADDERFFRSVVEPLVGMHFNFVKYIQYAQQPKGMIENLIKALNGRPTNKYLFVCDMDAHGDLTYCITKRKEKEYTDFGHTIAKERIIVVKEEIESWYYAGISTNNSLMVKSITNTESLTKEEFEKLIPKHFTSKTDFMIELLKNYAIDIAITQNASFSYLLQKLDSLLE